MKWQAATSRSTVYERSIPVSGNWDKMVDFSKRFLGQQGFRPSVEAADTVQFAGPPDNDTYSLLGVSDLYISQEGDQVFIRAHLWGLRKLQIMMTKYNLLVGLLWIASAGASQLLSIGGKNGLQLPLALFMYALLQLVPAWVFHRMRKTLTVSLDTFAKGLEASAKSP